MKALIAAGAVLAATTTAAGPSACDQHGGKAATHNTAQTPAATSAKPRAGWHVYAYGTDSSGPTTVYVATCLPDGADEEHPNPKQLRDVTITHAQYRAFGKVPRTADIPCPG